MPKFRLYASSLIGLLCLLSSCSPRRAVESLLLGDHFIRAPDLAYGPGARHRLDVYRPKEALTAAPVLVFLYGGRWRQGSKDEYRLLGDSFTRKEWVSVIPNVRNHPDGRFPGWVEDAALAVRWTRDNIGRFGGDARRIFVVGHSSGGHTAALLAMDERYLENAGLPRQAVKGFISLAGPVRTTWTDPDVQEAMGPAEGWPSTYPMIHIDGREPPVLLLHGSGDRTVSPDNSLQLAGDIHKQGGCARAVLYPGMSHFGIIKALATPRFSNASVLKDLGDFVRAPDSGACPFPREP